MRKEGGAGREKMQGAFVCEKRVCCAREKKGARKCGGGREKKTRTMHGALVSDAVAAAVV